MTQKQLRFDEAKDIEYPNWLYNYAATANADVKGFEAIKDKHVERVQDREYLVVEDAFTVDEVQVSLDSLYHLASGNVEGYDQIYSESSVHDQVDTKSPEERYDAIRKFFYFVEYEPRLKAMSHHSNLIKTMQTLIGEDELTMFQDMARPS